MGVIAVETLANFLSGTYITAGVSDTFANCFAPDPTSTGPLTLDARGLQTFPTAVANPIPGSVPVAINQMQQDLAINFSAGCTCIFSFYPVGSNGNTVFEYTDANTNFWSIGHGIPGGSPNEMQIHGDNGTADCFSIGNSAFTQQQIAFIYDGNDTVWWSWNGEPVQSIGGIGPFTRTAIIDTQFFGSGFFIPGINFEISYFALYQPGIVAQLPIYSTPGFVPPMTLPAKGATNAPPQLPIFDIPRNLGLWR